MEKQSEIASRVRIFTDFFTESKWFLNCNNFMVSKTDQSDGWIERFCFCEFKLRFCDEPKLPHERLADRTLESRLKAPEQLSAIFNWALEGYKILKATRNSHRAGRPKRRQHKTLFEVTNPIVVFVKEFRIEDCRIIQSQTRTCIETTVCGAMIRGHKALAKTSFDKRLPKAFREYRNDLEPFRCGNIPRLEKG